MSKEIQPKKPSSRTHFTDLEEEKLVQIVRSYPALWNAKDSDFRYMTKRDELWSKVGKILQKPAGNCRIRWRSIRDHYTRQKRLENVPSATKKRALYWDKLTFLDDAGDDPEASYVEPYDYNDAPSPVEHVLPEELNKNLEEDIEFDSSIEKQLNENLQIPVVDVSSLVEDTSLSSLTEDNSVSSSVVDISDNSPAKRKKPPAIRDFDAADVLDSMMNNRKGDETRQQCRKRMDNVMMKPDSPDNIDSFFKSIATTVKTFKPEDRAEVKTKVFELVLGMKFRSANRNYYGAYNKTYKS